MLRAGRPASLAGAAGFYKGAGRFSGSDPAERTKGASPEAPGAGRPASLAGAAGFYKGAGRFSGPDSAERTKGAFPEAPGAGRPAIARSGRFAA